MPEAIQKSIARIAATPTRKELSRLRVLLLEDHAGEEGGADDLADREIGAKVRAIGTEHLSHAVLAAHGDDAAVEEIETLHLPAC